MKMKCAFVIVLAVAFASAVAARVIDNEALPSNFIEEDVFSSFLQIDPSPTSTPSQSPMDIVPPSQRSEDEVPDDAAEAPPDLPIPEDDDDEEGADADEDDTTDDGVDDVDDDFGPATLLQVDQQTTSLDTPESLFLELYKVIHSNKRNTVTANQKTKTQQKKHKKTHKKKSTTHAKKHHVAKELPKEIDTAELSTEAPKDSTSSLDPEAELNSMPTADELDRAEKEAKLGGEALRRAVFLALSTRTTVHKENAKKSKQLPGQMPSGDEIEHAEKHALKRSSLLETAAVISPVEALPPPDDTYLAARRASQHKKKSSPKHEQKSVVAAPRFAESEPAGGAVNSLLTDNDVEALPTPDAVATPVGGSVDGARFTTKLHSEPTEAELTPIPSEHPEATTPPGAMMERPVDPPAAAAAAVATGPGPVEGAMSPPPGIPNPMSLQGPPPPRRGPVAEMDPSLALNPTTSSPLGLSVAPPNAAEVDRGNDWGHLSDDTDEKPTPAYQHQAFYEQPKWHDLAEMAMDDPGL